MDSRDGVSMATSDNCNELNGVLSAFVAPVPGV
ncbi:hypothetical protein SAMN05444583_11698 [Rhodococcus maanshanensis]|uniref:Uncharacterized protein n=1 Tax=Rhodococcus maanshanensis TaxID=183556 RepID=A0A1H7TU92_9NOCA|nr:hypothetical protein SAMN05444583_11698 [Rhodococcus maanshanensis]